MTWGDGAATNVGDGGWDLRRRRRRGCRRGGGGCYLAREGWGRGYWEGAHAAFTASAFTFVFRACLLAVAREVGVGFVDWSAFVCVC